MQRIAPVLLGLVFAVLSLFRAPAAEAASFQVNPVNVKLGAGTSSAMLSVRNLGDEEVRVQISVFGWRQTPSGEIDLQPTRDLVFFPSILTIAPRDSRNVRVSAAPGQDVSSVRVERTYRIIVEEMLPPVKMSLPFVGLRVLTRMSIPLFIPPATTRPMPVVEGLSVRPEEATFQVTNKGTTHFIVRAVRAFVSAPDGRRLFETSVAGWYVLARSSRLYRIALPAHACAEGGRVTVELETDQGDATQTIGSLRCN